MDDDFRDMMASFPTGVSVITAYADGAPAGMTCSALCSVSADPPMLLICLRAGSPTLSAVVGSGAFAVNLLHHRARSVAGLFASGDPDRFHRVSWRRGLHAGSPRLDEAAHTVSECSVERADVAGDHVVVLGMVRSVERVSDEQPLLYGFRSYGHWVGVPVAGSAPGALLSTGGLPGE